MCSITFIVVEPAGLVKLATGEAFNCYGFLRLAISSDIEDFCDDSIYRPFSLSNVLTSSSDVTYNGSIAECGITRLQYYPHYECTCCLGRYQAAGASDKYFYSLTELAKVIGIAYSEVRSWWQQRGYGTKYHEVPQIMPRLVTLDRHR